MCCAGLSVFFLLGPSYYSLRIGRICRIIRAGIRIEVSLLLRTLPLTIGTAIWRTQMRQRQRHDES